MTFLGDQVGLSTFQGASGNKVSAMAVALVLTVVKSEPARLRVPAQRPGFELPTGIQAPRKKTSMFSSTCLDVVPGEAERTD